MKSKNITWGDRFSHSAGIFPQDSSLNKRLLFVVAFTILSLLISLFAPMITKTASAAPEWSGGSFIADEVYKNTSAHQHYYWLYACFRHVDIDKVTPSEMSSWDFFQGDFNAQALGAMYSGETSSGALQGTRNCETESIVKTAFGYLGFSDPREAFCNLKGAQYRDDRDGKYDDCIAGVNDHDWDNNEDKETVAKSFESLAKSKKPPFGGAEEYVRAYATLVSERGCKMTFSDDTLYTSEDAVPNTGSDTVYAVPVFVRDSSDNKLVPRYIKGVGIPSGDSNMAYVATTSGDYYAFTKRSCNQIVGIARDNAAAYKDWLEKNPDAAGTGQVDGGKSLDEQDAGSTETSCAIDGIGWMVCPVMNFIAKIIDEAYLQVASWLSVTPILTTGGGAAMYSAWVAMRDIANVAFVIAIMIIVYSQITGFGVSNYGIKKLLPKIVIAAILVNVSYILCALAVDISNIAGTSLYSLLKSNAITGGIDTSHFEGDLTTTDGGWAGIVAAILASAAIIYLALPALIIALPTALLAIVTVFLVLALRQVLIILLIVISPLAFVALLLPNTEEWFTRWRKLFFTLLMMFPVISILFGASALASTVVMNSATDASGDGKIGLQLMGALITVLPLVLTPVVMKASSGVLNRFAGVVNNPNRGPFDALRKRAEATAGRIRNNRDIRAMDRPSWRSMRGSGLNSAMKRDKIQQRRDAKYKSLAYQGSNQAYTKRANDQEKITQTLENEFEERDIQGQLDGMGLHADVRANLLNSQFSRKVAESTEQNRAEEAHIMNNRNAYRQMYDTSENLDAMKTESHNDYAGTAQGEATAQRVLAATGEKKIIEGEHDLRFQSSQVGRDQSRQMKGVAGQLDVVHGEQEIDFESSNEGTDLAIAKDAVAQRKSEVVARNEELAVVDNQTVRVEAAAAQQSLAATKVSEEAFIEELKTDAGAAKAGPGLAQAAQELKAADTAKRAQTQRSGSAVNQGNIEYAEAVASGQVLAGGTETIAQVAGGVAARGEAKALAAAKATVTQEMMKNIENIQSTMPFELSSNPEALKAEFDRAGSTEEKVAILKAAYKNGSPGIQATREILTNWTSDPTADQDQIQTIKEIMQDDQGFQRAGRDFEVWSNNEHSQTDASGNKVPHNSFGEVTQDHTVWADISAQRFASMNKSSQKQAFAELDRADPTGALKASLVDRIYADSTARGQIKEGILETVRNSRTSRGLPFEE